MPDNENFIIHEKQNGRYVSRPARFKEGLQIRYGKGTGTLFFWAVQAFVLMLFFAMLSANKENNGCWILAVCALLGFFNNFVRSYKSNRKK